MPSLASDVSPSRCRFISLVDSVCAGTYNQIVQARARAAYLYGFFADHALLDSAYAVILHGWQLRSLVSLGRLPQARELYEAWLGNFGRRVSVERQVVLLYARNQPVAAQREVASLSGLKAQGNPLGQRFGLVRCTSNGDRTPIPILSDGQPKPLT